MVIDEEKEPSLKRKLVVFGLLAAFGAVIGAGAAHADIFDDLPWEDLLAVVIAVFLIATGIVSGVIMSRRPSEVPRDCGVLQVAVLIAGGLVMLGPVYATAWVEPGVVFAGVVLVLAAQTAANWMLWRRADEMLRRINTETAVLTFAIVHTALFLYAAAERLGLIQGLTAWAMIGIVMAVHLFSSCVAAARRGIH